MIITSISECIEKKQKYDKIFLTLSFGKDLPFFAYFPLGLGNLITAFVGALMIDENMEIINFYDMSIWPLRKLFNNPIYWYTRSNFTIYNFKNNFKRAVFPVAKFCNKTNTFLSADQRVLYLSTHMVNIDKLYFNNFAKLDRYKMNIKLLENFGLKILSSSLNKSFEIAVHIRRGDFMKSINFDAASVKPNCQIELPVMEQAICKLVNDYDCTKVLITSDENLLTIEKISILKKIHLFKPNIKVEFFQDLNAVVVLNRLLKADVLLISNSTFSFWAGALGGKPTYYLSDNAPYDGQLFLPNFKKINIL